MRATFDNDQQDHVGWLWSSVIGLFFVCGLVLVLLFFWLPYDLVKAWLDRYSYSGSVEYFDEAYFFGVTLRARIVGAGLLLLSSVMFIGRSHWAGFVQSLAGSWREQSLQFYAWIRSSSDHATRMHRILFVILLVLGFLLRMLYVDQPMRADEARTCISFAFRPVPLILADWSAANNQILHTLLVHGCYQLFGMSEVLLRLPAFIFGILSLWLFYLLGTKLYDRSVGLCVLAISSGMPIYINFSTNARGYSMVYVFFSLLLLAGIYLQKHPGNLVVWVLAGMSAVLGFFTIPIMLYGFMMFGCWMAFAGKPPGMSIGSWWWTLLAFAVVTGIGVGLLYAPAFIATDWSLIARNETVVGGNSWSHVWAELKKVWPGYQDLFFMPPLGLFIALLLLYGLGCSAQFPSVRRLSSGGWLALISVLVGVIVPFVIQRAVPFPRVYSVFLPVFFMPFFAVIAGWLRSQFPKASGSLIAILVLMLFGGQVMDTLSKTPGRQFRSGDQFSAAERSVLELLSRVHPDDDIVTMSPSASPMIFYARRHGLGNRIWDLLEYRPDAAKRGDRWIVVNLQQGRTLNRYLGWLQADGLGDDAELVFTIPDRVEIYRFAR
jgi:hypothetical protein